VEELICEQQHSKKEVETFEMLLEDKVTRAMKGEDAFQVSKCKVGPLESWI
jgi:hypothetical protein